MSKQKAKGTWFESKVVDYLRDHLGMPIERRTLGGVNDKGDIAGVHLADGREIVVECKNYQVYELKQWMREARREGANAGTIGVVVFHGKGVGAENMGDQFVLMGLREFCEIIGGEHV